jgi:hypothetical protein
MAFTYSGDPASSSRDAVRFLLNDTSTASAELNDAEVEWLVAEQPNVYRAAAQGARQLATQAANGVASKTVGSLTLTYSERATKWLDIADSLDDKAKKGLGSAIAAYSGGISKMDKEAIASDTDFDEPWFYRDMWDNPGADTAYAYPNGTQE